jgi:hypothetical protein
MIFGPLDFFLLPLPLLLPLPDMVTVEGADFRAVQKIQKKKNE